MPDVQRITKAPKAGGAKEYLGSLAQAVSQCKIYAAPKKGAEVYYTVKPYAYLVARRYDSKWLKILLENGKSGFAPSEKIALLPYRVTRDKTLPTLATSNDPRDVASRASQLVGRPIDRKLRGGGFISQVFKGSLPVSLFKQSETGRPVTRLEDLKPGDRVYFWDNDKDEIGFGGIFLGNGYFVGPLPHRNKIETDYLGKKNWLKDLVCARR